MSAIQQATPEIDRVELHRAGGPIPRQGNARTSWERRDAVLVALHDHEGRVGLGEAAPLPGYLDDVVDVEALRQREPSGPATAYALELAELDLRGQIEGRPISELLGLGTGHDVEVSALLGDPGADDAAARAKRLVAAGARTLKLKLGTRPIADDVAAVRRVRAAVGAGVAFVGDANGAWTCAEARAATTELAPLQFAYVEQPVAPGALLALGAVAIPVWADESLASRAHRDAVVGAPHVAGVVCKPTALGGLRACVDLAARAHRLGKGVVVTHALEGPVALAGCAALARGLGDIAPRAGLWPHEARHAFPEVALPGYAGGVLRAIASPGLGFTAAERARLLALPRLEGDR